MTEARLSRYEVGDIRQRRAKGKIRSLFSSSMFANNLA